MKFYPGQFIFFSILILTVAGCSSHRKVSAKKDNESRQRSYYEKKLGVEIPYYGNLKLYAAIDRWIGVPHKLGACETSGIDCSCLVSVLCREAYECNTPRDTKGLMESCRKIEVNELKEGDIVFFSIKNGRADHVGLFLSNGKFVHTSIKRGVMISDLKENYYTKYFAGAGRLKCS